MNVAATSRPLRRNISVTPVASLLTTWTNPNGNSACVMPVASSTRAAGSTIRLSRKTRQTAARPTSQSMYWGLITRLVVVNSSTAVNAASAGVLTRKSRARSRHTSSQPNATTDRPRESVLTRGTCGPRNSREP